LNSIWEGSGNVNCLDVLRAIEREPESLDVFLAEVARAGDPRLTRAVSALQRELAVPEQAEAGARRLVERLALTLQASLLIRHGDPHAAEAFVESRLAGAGGRAYGTLPPGPDLARIVERHRPAV
jgi:putative acyl-CoA dehydrogenase